MTDTVQTVIETDATPNPSSVFIGEWGGYLPWHDAILFVQNMVAKAMALTAEGKPREAHDLAKPALAHAITCKKNTATEDQFGWAGTIEDLALLALDLAKAALVTA